MKIGITTYHSEPNFGAALQAYALQTYLRKVGQDPFFINYRYRLGPIRTGFRWQLIKLCQRAVWGRHEARLRSAFRSFQECCLNVDDRRYLTSEEIMSHPPEADVLICGSDQVWNPIFCNSEVERVLWLAFAEKRGTRRVSYAPSFGGRDLTPEIRNRWMAYIRPFHAVSVREKEGVERVASLGRTDAVCVPDPTLLLDEKDYIAIEQEPRSRIEDQFNFIYMLAPDSSAEVKTIQELLSNRDSLPCHCLDPTSRARSSYTDPRESLYWLRRSRFVVTNSYHGMIFSIIFKKPFIVLLRRALYFERNTRVTSLAEILGISHRVVFGLEIERIEELMREPIDWNDVYRKLDAFRSVGNGFLASALTR